MKTIVKLILHLIEKFRLSILGIKIYYLHCGDLIKPIQGKITGNQFIIISRVLDVKMFYEKGCFFWHTKIKEYATGKALEKEEKELFDSKFKKLLLSIDKNGLSPNCQYLSISKKPISVNNGTHRLAYNLVKNNNNFIPVRVDFINLLRYTDGVEYLHSLNIPDNIINYLTNEYIQMLSNCRTYNSGVIESNNKVVYEILESFGFCRFGQPFIFIYKDTDLIINYRIKKILKRLSGKSIIPFTIELFKQELYVKSFSIYSSTVDNILEQIKKKGINWDGIISNTVTDSITLETYFNLNSNTDFFIVNK